MRIAIAVLMFFIFSIHAGEFTKVPILLKKDGEESYTIGFKDRKGNIYFEEYMVKPDGDTYASDGGEFHWLGHIVDIEKNGKIVIIVFKNVFYIDYRRED